MGDMDAGNHAQSTSSEPHKVENGSNDALHQDRASRSGSPEGESITPLDDHSQNLREAVQPAVEGPLELRAEAQPLEPKKTLVDTVTDKIRGESMSLPPDSPIKNAKSTVPESNNDNSGSDGDSSDKERSRKRKLSSRSSAANEAAVRLHPKRPKESDVPEREEDLEEAALEGSDETSARKSTQVFGFGSFASVKSPFTTGQVNASTVAPDIQSTTSQTGAVANSSSSPVLDGPPPSVALANTQSAISSKKPNAGGFAAFAATSPFQRSSIPLSSSDAVSEQRESLAGPVRRSKSPVGKHQAFGQYSAGVSRFGNMPSRRTQEDFDRRAASAESRSGDVVEFEDILKTKGEVVADHSASKLDIQEIEHNTGEEDDLTIFQTRAKLYTQDETFAYKERGTGLLKVNVRRNDGEGARIVMRAEGVLRLLLNMPLYPGLICELGPDPKFVKVAEITTHERKLHAVKVGNAKLAQELYDHLMDNTPSKSLLGTVA